MEPAPPRGRARNGHCREFCQVHYTLHSALHTTHCTTHCTAHYTLHCTQPTALHTTRCNKVQTSHYTDTYTAFTFQKQRAMYCDSVQYELHNTKCTLGGRYSVQSISILIYYEIWVNNDDIEILRYHPTLDIDDMLPTPRYQQYIGIDGSQNLLKLP